jgi:hypothetical protein
MLKKAIEVVEMVEQFDVEAQGRTVQYYKDRVANAKRQLRNEKDDLRVASIRLHDLKKELKHRGK